MLLGFNAGFCHPTAHGMLETVGLARAPGWRGPYTLLAAPTPGGAVFGGGPRAPAHRCEDPFLWRSKRGYHLLVHNQQPLSGDGTEVSALGFSEDGFAWRMAPRAPYDCTVRYADGTTGEAAMCGNRPHLVFAGTGATGGSGGGGGGEGAPVYLLNGASAGPHDPDAGLTYSLMRPIRSS